jgi:hypothetical protein
MREGFISLGPIRSQAHQIKYLSNTEYFVREGEVGKIRVRLPHDQRRQDERKSDRKKRKEGREIKWRGKDREASSRVKVGQEREEGLSFTWQLKAGMANN